MRGQRLNLLTNEPCAMNIIHGMEKKCKCFFADCRLRTGIDDIYSFYKYPPLPFLNPGLSGKWHPRNDRFFEMAGAWCEELYPRNDWFFEMAGAGCEELYPRNDRFFKMAGAWCGERHPRNDRIKKEILLPEGGVIRIRLWREFWFKSKEGISSYEKNKKYHEEDRGGGGCNAYFRACLSGGGVCRA